MERIRLWFCFALLLWCLRGTKLDYTRNCKPGGITIREDNGFTLECQGIPWHHNIYWSITDDSGNEVRIGDCTTDRTCTETTDDYYLTRQGPDNNDQKSLLRIQGHYREKVGKTIKCSKRSNDTAINCKVAKVFYPADVIGCQVTTNVDTWTVQGFCLVQKIFSSDSDYVCVWKQQRVGSDQTVRMVGEFRLSNFTNEQKLYYTGNCSFNRSLPDEAGNYSYHVTIRPGATLNNVGTVEIEFPGDPHISCSEFAIETKTHTCQCTPSATKPGKPAPSLSWPGLSSTGELTRSNVQRDDNGTQFTCQLTWGPDHRTVKTADYTLQVAYGPAKAAIVDSEISTNRRRLTCSFDDVNPAAVFNWTGFDCDAREQNETDNVCVIEVNSDDEGKEITCTATNVVDSSLKASASFRVRIGKGVREAGQDEAFPTAAIAGGVGAAVVVIIIVIVVVVILNKRNAAADEDNEVINNTEDQNESERQTYDRLQQDPAADDRNYTQLTVSNATSSTQSQGDSRMYDRLCPDSVADERNYTALAMSTVSSNVESQDNTYYNTAPQSEHRDPATSSYTNVENAIVRSETRATVERPGIHTDSSQQISVADGIYEST